jgi:hypothetical protein
MNTFTSTAGIAGSNFQIMRPPANGNGAPPANSFPAGTSYLSVLGGSATINFAAPVSAIQFDWGSIDSYNTLTVNGISSITVIPGSNFANPANGNQSASATNGRFTISGDAGELFTSTTFASTGNPFEVDDLAVRGAVSEPATRAMMILGFGAIGTAMRRRQKVRVSFA